MLAALRQNYPILLFASFIVAPISIISGLALAPILIITALIPILRILREREYNLLIMSNPAKILFALSWMYYR